DHRARDAVAEVVHLDRLLARARRRAGAWLRGDRRAVSPAVVDRVLPALAGHVAHPRVAAPGAAASGEGEGESSQRAPHALEFNACGRTLGLDWRWNGKRGSERVA